MSLLSYHLGLELEYSDLREIDMKVCTKEITAVDQVHIYGKMGINMLASFTKDV